MEWGTWESIVTIVATAGGIGYSIWRWVCKPYIWVPCMRAIGNIRAVPLMRHRIEAIYSQHAEVLKELGTITTMVKEVTKELRPNGGSSLRDRIDNLHTTVERNQKLTRAMLSTVSDGFVEFNADGGLMAISRGVLRRLGGRTEGELLGNNWVTCLNPHDRRKAVTEVEHAMRDERDIDLEIEFMAIGATRSTPGIPVRIALQAMSANDKLSGWVGTIKFP